MIVELERITPERWDAIAGLPSYKRNGLVLLVLGHLAEEAADYNTRAKADPTAAKTEAAEAADELFWGAIETLERGELR